MTGLEIYLEELAMGKQSQLDNFQDLHDKCYGPGYGGHVPYFAKSRDIVPPLIAVARAAYKLLGEGADYHQDSEPYQAIERELHNALRDLEGV